MKTSLANRNLMALFSQGTIIFSCLAITVFYLLSIGNNLVIALGQDRSLAFLLAPFNVETSVAYVQSLSSQRTTLSKRDEVILRLFHGRDSQVIAELAKYYYDVGKREKAMQFVNLAILYDRFNLEHYKTYVKIYRQQWQHPLLEEAFFLSGVYLPIDFQGKVTASYRSMQAMKPIDGERDMPSLDNSNISEGQVRPYLARAFYLLGFSVLDKDLILTKMFWQLAAEIKPNLSYYAAELASLMWFEFGDYNGAIEALLGCEREARKHCEELFKEASQDPPVFFPIGYFRQQIMDTSLL